MNEHPTINDAKALAMKYRKLGVMVLHFGGRNMQYGGASYGMTRRHCDAMGKLLDRIMELIDQGIIDVPQELR